MSEITRGVIGMPYEMAMGSELSRRQFHTIAQELFAEIGQLKDVNEALQRHISAQAEANGLLYQNIDVRDELCAVLEGNIGHMQKSIDLQKQIIEDLRSTAIASRKIESTQGEIISQLMAKLGMEAILHA